MVRLSRLIPVLLLIAALVACSGGGEKTPPPSETQAPERTMTRRRVTGPHLGASWLA